MLKTLKCAIRISTILLVILLTACGTTFGDFISNIEKYPENRFCVLTVEPIAGGRTEEAVRNGRVGGFTWCANNVERATRESLNACNQRIGKTCVVAYVYDRQINRYDSLQSKNVIDYENAVKEEKMKKCDGYGFRRGTTPFAQCLQKVEQQEAIDNAIKMQQNELNRQAQERQWKKAQCYASGRLDC